MKNIIVFCGMILFVLGCNRFVTVYHISESEKFVDSHGFYYTLPRTVLNIEVTVEKTDRVKGPYAVYANKYLGLSNVITENSTEYNIADISITTLNEPDPNKFYFVKLPEKYKNKNKPLISLNEYGILKSINWPFDTLKYKPVFSQDIHKLKDDIDNRPFKMLVNYNILEQVDTIFEIVHLDTMKIEKQILKRSFVEKSVEQKAKETSEHIIKLNEYKMNLISGYHEVPYSEETLQLMLSSIDQQINEYISLFTGKIIQNNLNYHLLHIPESLDKVTNVFLFSFDKRTGLSYSKDKDERKHIYLELTFSIFTKRINNIVNEQKENIKSEKGFYYNIPEKTKLTLTRNNGEKIYEKHVLINQFGLVHFLPPGELKVLMHENNASLKRIEP